MAEEEREEDPQAVDPAVVLVNIEQRTKTNKFLFSVLLGFCAVIVVVMATGLTVMYLKISTLTEAAEKTSDDAVEEQFIMLEQQLMLLADFRKSELKKIKAYTGQLEKIADGCSFEKAAPYREFLLTREQDYQRLLKAIKSGTSDLAGMSRGSKKWLSPHQKEVQELIELSGAREQRLESLIRKQEGG